jgi:hypothetical protein
MLTKLSTKAEKGAKAAAPVSVQEKASSEIGASYGMPLFLRSQKSAAAGDSKDMPFPYSQRILQATGASLSLSSVLDAPGCARRETPSFTEGMTTHFSSETPSLHVAAHEAAHQLQHAGLTRDFGLGPEGHAGAVADAITDGRPATALIGNRGQPVSLSTRNYVATDGAGKWKGVSAGAVFARLAENGEAWTRGGHDAFATPSSIASANNILQAKQSGISVSAGSDAKTVEAPDGSGSKSLSKLDVKFDVDPTGKTFYGDCRQAAREVMGPKGSDKPEDVICSPGGTPTMLPSRPIDMVPKLVFVDKRISETPDYDKMTPDQKQEVIAKARDDYDDLSSEEKDKLRKSPIAAEKAKQLGIDQYAQPGVGEAFAVFPAQPGGIGQFDFHYATVIMVAGPDRLTLENAGEAKDTKTEAWFMQIYGQRKQQSFQEEHESFGPGAHTVVVITMPPAPSDVGDYPTLSTSELIRRSKASTDANEKSYLDLELGRRAVTAVVEVVKKDSWIMDDRVQIAFAGQKTETQQIPEGRSGTFSMPVKSISPVGDPLQINVYEGILWGKLIGSASWPDPYSPLSTSLVRGKTTYTLKVSM